MAVWWSISFLPSYAQNESRVLHLNIEKNENGETVKIDTTIELDKLEQDMQTLLRNFGFDNEGMLSWEQSPFGFEAPDKDLFFNFNTDSLMQQEERPFMGVTLVQEQNIENTDGGSPKGSTSVRIESVMKDGAAELAGVQNGDEIIAIDGVAMNEVKDVIDYVQSKKVGEVLQLSLRRNGQMLTLSLTLKTRSGTLGSNMLPPAFHNFPFFRGNDFEWHAQPDPKSGGNCHTPKRRGGNCGGTCKDMMCSPPNGKVMLGIIPKPISDDIKAQSQLNNRLGVYVEEVLPNSAAEAAKLQQGDIILEINDTDVNNNYGLMEILSQYEPNEKIKIIIWRNGKKQKLTATLQARPAPQQRHPDDIYFFDEKSEENGAAETPDKKVLRKEIIIREDENAATPQQKNITIEDWKESDTQQWIHKNNTAPSENSDVLLLQELSYYPNPNQGAFTLHFRSADKNAVRVRIMNMQGREIFIEHLEPFEGEYHRDIELNRVAAGVYLLQIEQGGSVFSKKIIVE